MIFVDELKKAIGIITLRDKNAQPMGVGQAITFYYKAALIPVILAIILSIIAASVGSSAGIYSAIVVTGVVVGIVLTYLFAPLGFLISAGIYQLFGKYLYRKFKGDYSKTLSAVLYGYLVSVLFIWILQPLSTVVAGAASSAVLSGIGGSAAAGTFMGLAGTALAILVVYYIIALIIGIWELIVSITYVSRFQNVSKLWAFLIGITPAIIVGIIVLIAVFALGVV